MALKKGEVKRTCKVDGCNEEHCAKGYFKKHYKVFNRLGKPFSDRPTFHGTPEERFWHYTKKGAEGECWEWIGNKDKDGYGQMRDGKRMVRPHRFSYEIHHGPIPNGLSVLHKCNNPTCVNPNHLYLGNHKQNMKDRKKAGNYYKNEKHPMCKFSNETVLAVRKEKGKRSDIAKKYGISLSQVSNIRNEKQRSIL
jgi:hypothetical protein